MDENSSVLKRKVRSSIVLPIMETRSSKYFRYPEFAVESRRLRSFDDWPKSMRQNPKELSDAGFFYTQRGDRVRCFSCGLGLRDWEEKDVPWEQQVMWSSECEYLKLVKGQNYIDSILKLRDESETECEDNRQNEIETEVNKVILNSAGSKLSSNDDENEKNLIKSKLCKICYASEYNTVFVPCYHVFACVKCASSVTECSICRKPFESIKRIYFS